MMGTVFTTSSKARRSPRGGTRSGRAEVEPVAYAQSHSVRLSGPGTGSPRPVLTDSTALCTGSLDRDREPGRSNQTVKGSLQIMPAKVPAPPLGLPGRAHQP